MQSIGAALDMECSAAFGAKINQLESKRWNFPESKAEKETRLTYEKKDIFNCYANKPDQPSTLEAISKIIIKKIKKAPSFHTISAFVLQGRLFE